MANHELVLGHGQNAELALGQNHHDFGQDHGLGLGHGHELDLGSHHHDHDLVLGQSHEHDHELVLGQSHDHDLGLGHHDDDHQLVLGHDHHHHGGELALRQGHEGDSGALDVQGHHHDELELSDSHELTLAETHHLGVDQNLDDQLTLEQAHELALHPHDLSQAPLAVAPVVQSRTMVVSPEFQLAVGQEFPEVMSCRRAIRNTAIACHFEIQTVKSDKTRFTAKCAAEGCPWRIHAAKLPGVPTFSIRTIHDNHSCVGINHLGHQQASVQWVANTVEERLRENPQCKPKEILEEIHKAHGITLSYKQAWRGKERIMAAVRGSFEEGYRLLPEYCKQVERTNPGSIARVYGNPDDNCFRRLFISFNASIFGFVNACRPLIGLDRVLLKNKYLGTLLLATGFDGDGALFPLAFGVVDEETDENWVWFLSELHELLEKNTENMPRLTILSDRRKGIIDGVEFNFPTAFHGFCMRHVSETFKKEFSNPQLVNLLWEAAHALTVIEFETKLLEIEDTSPEAVVWIRHLPPRLWATAYFEGTRYGHLTANITESLNSWILDASSLPIIQMMECIRRQLMTWFNERREASMQWTTILVPLAERRVQELSHSVLARAPGEALSPPPPHTPTALRNSPPPTRRVPAMPEKCGAAEKVKPAASPAAEKPADIAGNISYHAQYSPHFSPLAFGPEEAFYATAESVRDHLIERWNDTYVHFHKTDPKQTYYLSMEYLQGRALTNAVGNLGITGAYAEAVKKFGYELEVLAGQEKDAALGNGGLGRLASCFLDSMATLNLPAWGYGLRYRYGLFKQHIAKEGQEETAEDWLDKFSPWEIPRHDVVFPVRFFGHVEILPDGSRKWVGGEVLKALAYDVPIPGYKTKNAISLRLWEAKATAEDFNLFQFNDGQYESAAQLHARAQQICAVLYPGDATEEGKLLRLKQQFFLCSASLQDMIARFKERKADRASGKWSEFPTKVAVQLNDTHPTLAIPELMRLLMDEEGLGWDEAWDITYRTVSYTNHTVLPEALEKWSQIVMRKLLPRHMEIIEEIDKRFRELVISKHKEMEGKIDSMKVLDSSNPQKPVVRMANLCVVSSHTVNGVAELHSNILKQELFADYVSIWPNKFQNKTNGITPRRWLKFCNPELSEIVTKWLKTDQWTSNLDLLTGLRKFADDEKLHAEWAAAKLACKKRLAKHVLDVTGVTIDPTSLFDIQIKRIHEYKRQLLNILGAVYRYKKLKEMSAEEKQKVTPRTVMLGGKAFATYTNAKRIVKLVNDVGAVVNNDPEVNKYLKVVFIPNYNVSVAEVLIPGSELSQHISTAGMEASGTSNMKFSLNGCVIIGTLDGANVEIREEVGEDNFFLFGAKADEVAGLRKDRENGLFKPDPRFEEAKQLIRSGAFGSYNYEPLLDSLEGNSGFGRGDYFLVGYDFPGYIDAQDRVDAAYKDKKKWIKMSILNTAGSGKFSSDRTIAQYAKEIWDIKASPVA